MYPYEKKQYPKYSSKRAKIVQWRFRSLLGLPACLQFPSCPQCWGAPPCPHSGFSFKGLIVVEFLSIFPAVMSYCRAKLSSEKGERSFSTKINERSWALIAARLRAQCFFLILQFQKLLYAVCELTVTQPISL